MYVLNVTLQDRFDTRSKITGPYSTQQKAADCVINNYDLFLGLLGWDEDDIKEYHKEGHEPPTYNASYADLSHEQEEEMQISIVEVIQLV